MKPEITPQIPFAEGFIIPINKPLEWTSFDVVGKIKNQLRKFGHKKIKVGHAGTLDPLATGVLVVCIGKATKRADELQAQTKEYLTTIRLGATTPSYDMEHPEDKTYPTEHITRQATEQALAEMTGEQLQIPPIFSAKFIDGKRAYEYAREGEVVQMRKALINIYSIELVDFSLPELTIRVSCSKGTYIRSMARDLGEKLGSGGYITALCRTKSGSYDLDSCYEIDEIIDIFNQKDI